MSQESVDLHAVARRLRMRHYHGERHQDLAREIGVAPSTVTKLLKPQRYGMNHEHTTLYKLRKWMGELSPVQVALERFGQGEEIALAALHSGCTTDELEAAIRLALRGRRSR